LSAVQKAVLNNTVLTRRRKDRADVPLMRSGGGRHGALSSRIFRLSLKKFSRRKEPESFKVTRPIRTQRATRWNLATARVRVAGAMADTTGLTPMLRAAASLGDVAEAPPLPSLVLPMPAARPAPTAPKNLKTLKPSMSRTAASRTLLAETLSEDDSDEGEASKAPRNVLLSPGKRAAVRPAPTDASVANCAA
jgi:hypothetical protein